MARWPGPGSACSASWQLVHPKRSECALGCVKRCASSVWQTTQLWSLSWTAKPAACAWQSVHAAV
jgi:hypothetical protein